MRRAVDPPVAGPSKGLRSRRVAVLVFAVLGVAGCTSFSAAPGYPSAVRIDCATAAVVGLRWSAAADSAKSARYRILRDGQPIGTTADLSFVDTSVTASATYTYLISAIDPGSVTASAALTVATPPAAQNGDAPYCSSPRILTMAWDWQGGYRAADGSDLWPVTWGQDGNVYAFFGDGGGFGGDDIRGRTSFGIAMITARPPLNAAAESNLYGGYHSRYPAHLSGKARSIIAVGSDFYAIAGIYRSTDPKSREPPPISGSPEHVEMA